MRCDGWRPFYLFELLMAVMIVAVCRHWVKEKTVSRLAGNFFYGMLKVGSFSNKGVQSPSS